MTGVMTIFSFLIGVAAAFFVTCALYILTRPDRTRFQTVLGRIFVVWALLSVKDLVLAFPGMYRQPVLDVVFLIDGWSVATFTVFLMEIVRPGWTDVIKLLLVLLPFWANTVVYFVWPAGRHGIILVYTWMLVAFALAILAVGFVTTRRHIKYVRANFSNIDNIDVLWLRQVFFFFIAGQLLWLGVSFASNPAADCCYYVVTLAMWMMVLRYGYNFRPIVMQPVEPVDESEAEPRQYSFAGQVERVIKEESLYLNPNLTLMDVAKRVGTNRTYMSEYFSRVLQDTFYDYINRLRLENMSLPTMREHPEFTLEHVAQISGFNSMSTFRRAFTKHTGMSPGQWRRERLAGCDE